MPVTCVCAEYELGLVDSACTADVKLPKIALSELDELGEPYIS